MSDSPSIKTILMTVILFWCFAVALKLIGYVPLLSWSVILLPVAAPFCTIGFYFLAVTIKIVYEDHKEEKKE